MTPALDKRLAEIEARLAIDDSKETRKEMATLFTLVRDIKSALERLNREHRSQIMGAPCGCFACDTLARAERLAGGSNE